MTNKIERIIVHWDAGNGTMNDYIKKYYHFMVDKNAEIHNGYFTPEDNLDTSDERYCPHVGGMNTGSIGVAALGMWGFELGKKKSIYEINRLQMEKLFKFVAQLCHKYDLKPIDGVINTHAEIGYKVLTGKIKRTQLTALNVGKQDILYLPYEPELRPENVGGYIRNKINWYYEKIGENGDNICSDVAYIRGIEEAKK